MGNEREEFNRRRPDTSRPEKQDPTSESREKVPPVSDEASAAPPPARSESAGGPPSATEALAEYAKPLTESTDGSPEQMEKALSIARICWNLAQIEDPARQEQTIAKIKEMLPFGEEEFAQFRQDIIEMMIGRHHRMFPDRHNKKGD